MGENKEEEYLKEILEMKKRDQKIINIIKRIVIIALVIGGIALISHISTNNVIGK